MNFISFDKKRSNIMNQMEIVQLYFHDVNETNDPLETLKGFQRVDVAAGKTVHAVISLPSSSFEFYDRMERFYNFK
jgi:beta-glucosidase